MTTRSQDPEFALKKYAELKSAGIQCLLKGYYEEALSSFQTAAFIANSGCPGLFYDEQLEDALRYISARLFNHSVSHRDGSGTKIRIGYILSALQDSGGHAQTLLRLLRHHQREEFDLHVYTTEIMDSKKTAPLQYKELMDLNVPVWSSPDESSLLERAISLRERVQEDKLDILILFVHPWDTASIIAIMDIPSAVTVFFHFHSVSFNLGMNLFDYHIDYRENFHNLCQDLKFMDNRLVLPLPGPGLDYIDQIPPIARDKFGIPPGATISATAGAIYKLFYGDASLYFDTIERVLKENPDHYHILVGSTYGNSRYATRLQDIISQKQVFQKRLILWDNQPEVISLLKAVDVYLDSFPLGGGNICHEAMACGTPVVVLNDLKLNKYSPYPYSVGIDECMASNTDEYVAMVTGFLRDQTLRGRVGNLLRERFIKNFKAEDVTRAYETCYRSWVSIARRPERRHDIFTLRNSLNGGNSAPLQLKGILYAHAVLDSGEIEGFLHSGSHTMLNHHPYVAHLNSEMENTTSQLGWTQEQLRQTQEQLNRAGEQLRLTVEQAKMDKSLADKIRKSVFYTLYRKYFRSFIK